MKRKDISPEPEIDIAEILDLLENIAPAVARITDSTQLINERIETSEMTDEERQKLKRILIDMFEYGVCLGLNPFLKMISYQSDDNANNKSAMNMRCVNRLLREIREETKEEYWEKVLDSEDVSNMMDHGMNTGVILSKILITFMFGILQGRKEGMENEENC